MSSLAVNSPVTVHLHGALRKRFGGLFKLHVRTTAEAIRLLEANFRGKFYKHLRTGSYFVIWGEDPRTGVGLSPDRLRAGLNSGHLHIFPSTRGSFGRRGIFMAILGTVLIGAALVLSGGTLAGAAFSLGSLSVSNSTIAALGASMLIGGITQMMTPHAEATPETKNNPMFNGPQQTSQQGVCVPVVYGRARVGPVIVSAGIHTDSTGDLGGSVGNVSGLLLKGS